MPKIKILLAAVVIASGAVLSAAPWAAHNSQRRPHTLIVVSNHKTPRLMAETILALTRQNYLLVTADGRYFVALPKDTVQIPEDKFATYINDMQVRRLVILGDERYISREVENKLRTINLKRIPIVRIYGDYWPRVAEELDDLLNIGNLKREFVRNYVDMRLRDRPLQDQSGAAPAAPMAPAAPELPEASAPAAAAGNSAAPIVDPEK